MRQREETELSRTYSLSALTVIELSPPEMVTAAAAAGYDHVGLRIIPATPEERGYPVIGDTPMVRDILKRIDDTGVSVFDVEVFRLKPDTRVDDYKPALDAAARLGASNILVTGQDPEMGRLAEKFAAICDLAAPLKITANVEYMPWIEINTLAKARTLLDTAKRTNAGVLLDAMHVDRCLTTPQELRQIPRERLRYVQLCDAPAERPTDVAQLLHQARQERKMPGEGGLKLMEFLRAVPADIPISLEVAAAEMAKTVPAVERARRALVAAKGLVARL